MILLISCTMATLAFGQEVTPKPHLSHEAVDQLRAIKAEMRLLQVQATLLSTRAELIRISACAEAGVKPAECGQADTETGAVGVKPKDPAKK